MHQSSVSRTGSPAVSQIGSDLPTASSPAVALAGSPVPVPLGVHEALPTRHRSKKSKHSSHSRSSARNRSRSRSPHHKKHKKRAKTPPSSLKVAHRSVTRILSYYYVTIMLLDHVITCDTIMKKTRTVHLRFSMSLRHILLAFPPCQRGQSDTLIDNLIPPLSCYHFNQDLSWLSIGLSIDLPNIAEEARLQDARLLDAV